MTGEVWSTVHNARFAHCQLKISETEMSSAPWHHIVCMCRFAAMLTGGLLW